MGLAVAPASAQTADPSARAQVQVPLRVRVGEQLILRAPAGTIHAEATDPSVAAVTMPSPDTIVVGGIRPADTILLLVNSATVAMQPVHVTPPLDLAGTIVGAPSPVGFVDLTYLPEAQVLSVDIHRPGLDATIDSSAWQVHLLTGTVSVIGASDLQTPLQNFGVASGWGTSVRTADGWELIASTSQSQIVHHWPLGGPSEAELAATVAGPLAAVHLEGGPIAVDLAALYQDGAAQSTGTVVARIGTVVWTYSFGPQGAGLSGQLIQDGWTLSAAGGPQGAQVGLGATIGTGSRVNFWWTAQGGYGLAMTLPLGAAGAVTAAASSGGVFAATNVAEDPAAAVTSTTGFGVGQLTVTSPPPGFPVMLASPAALRLWQPPQWVPGGGYSVTPSVVRTRVEIPAGRAATVPPPPVAAGSGPVSIPTGSAAVIVHTCLHSASPKTTCDPRDPGIAVRLYVDDVTAELTGVALPVAPGPHAIAIHPEDLPPFVVPLGPLTCPISPVAGSVVVCDFAFRQAGTP